MKKFLLVAIIIGCCTSLAASYAVDMSTFNAGRTAGQQLAGGIFDHIIKVAVGLSKEQKQAIRDTHKEYVIRLQIQNDPEQMKCVEAFYEELRDAVDQSVETMNRLMDKHPIMHKIMHGGEVLNDFIMGIAQVIVERTGMEQNEAIAVSYKLIPLFLVDVK